MDACAPTCHRLQPSQTSGFYMILAESCKSRLASLSLELRPVQLIGTRPILGSPRHVHLACMLHSLWGSDLLGTPEPSARWAGQATPLCREPAEVLECLDAVCRSRSFLQPVLSRQKAALRFAKEGGLRELELKPKSKCERSHERRHDDLGDLGFGD